MTPFTIEFDDYNFPDDPKQYPQWVVCDKSKIPLYSPGLQKPLEKASPTDPKTWMSYDTALNLCELNEGLLPGFVLTPEDPFTVIDLDVKDATPQEHIDWFYQIMKGSNSYAEITSGGRGLHIWLLGNYGEGKRSSSYNLERYSQERFIICTGQVASALPISEGNGVIQYLEPYLDTKARILVTVADGPQVRSDEDILEDCVDWANGDLFQELMYLPLAELQARRGYPSGSEADAALVNFLVKASPNNEQVKRMFRSSALAKRGPKPGQKDKIMADDKYLDRTINNYRSILQVEKQAEDAQREAMIAISRNNIANMMANMEQKQEEVRQQLAINDAKFDIEKTEYDFPPGPIGELAKWIYQTSTLPVAVISITTALAIATTCTAKGWRFLDKHLNAFYIIAARSGTGKNAMHQGIGRICKMLTERNIPAYDIFGASDMRSTIAWRKKLIEQVNYCQLLPEIGTLLEDMNGQSNPHANERKQFILNAYSAAQEGVMSGGAEYSNKESNVDSANTELTLTIIGETTLDSLFKNLTGKLAADGFMSRFNYGVYEGYTVERNFNTKLEIPKYIIDLLEWMLRRQQSVCDLLSEPYDIPVSEEGKARLLHIHKTLQAKLGNEGKMDDETLRQIYNRVQERIERMAGTFAVFRKPDDPIVDVEDIEWPYAYVMSSTNMMLEKYKAGEIGEMSDEKVRRIVAKAIQRYFAADLENSASEMRYINHQRRMIFLRTNIQSRSFTQLRRLEQSRICEKPSRALWRILQDFTSEGLIRPVGDGEKAVLAAPTDGSVPIVIEKSTDAWFITNLEGIAAICND